MSNQDKDEIKSVNAGTEENPVWVIPRKHPRQLNPETDRQLTELFSKANEEVLRRDDAVRQLAEKAGDAYLKGGSEAMQEAIEQHLQSVKKPSQTSVSETSGESEKPNQP